MAIRAANGEFHSSREEVTRHRPAIIDLWKQETRRLVDCGSQGGGAGSTARL